MRPVSGVSSAAASAVAPLPAHCVRLAGIDADVLLPGGVSWQSYARALDAARVFSGTGFQALSEQRGHATAAGPRIGILVSDPAALRGALGVATLIKDVRTMGAVPLLIPPCADVALPKGERDAAIGAMINALDGVIGPGGADVAPSIYGESLTHAEDVNAPRDRFEADFALRAMASDVFMLGICRSHQLWNAASGGKLVQDLQKDGVVSLSQRQTDFGLAKDRPFVLQDIVGRVMFEHRVELAPSALASIVGAQTLLTNSFHHQAVRTPGKGLAPIGVVVDPKSGARAIEATAGRNVLTLQWHPELMPNDPTQRRVLETVGRRAHVVHLAKGLRAAGELNERALAAAMKKSGVDFDREDFAFARANYR